jgi:TonB family protein
MTDALAEVAPVSSCLARSLAAHGLIAVVALGLVRARPRPAPVRTLVAFDMMRIERVVSRPAPTPHTATSSVPTASERPSTVRAPRPAPFAPRASRPATPAPASLPAPAPAPQIVTATGGSEPVAASSPSPSAAAPTPLAPQGSAHAPSSPPGDPAASLDLGSYLSGLAARVGRFQSYPLVAREMGLEGTVVVRLVVREDGSLAAAPAVDASSGHELLDDEALRIVAHAAPFAPPLGHRGLLTLRVPVRFHLED